MYRSNNSLVLKVPVNQFYILYQNQDSINLLYDDTKTKISYLNQNINKLPRPKKVIPKTYVFRFSNHLRNVSATQIGSYIWMNGIFL